MLPVLLLSIAIECSSAYTGPPPPPDVLANEFYENFTIAVNSKDPEVIKPFFAPSFLEDPTTYKIYESISAELAGYVFSVEHAFYDVYKTPKRNWWLLNTTMRFRGPHPEYTRKHFNILLENQNRNAMLFPDQWKIKAMITKVYSRKSFADDQVTPEPGQILTQVLQEFLESVNTRDIPRLERLLNLTNSEVVSPTGMQQLNEMLGSNRVEVRSARYIFNGDITGTVLFRNEYSGVANLFYFVIRKADAVLYSWKILDMKMMFEGYGVPNGFAGMDWGDI